ncbi:MAG: PDZ domain-containing protein [Actinomycetota bacterium]|nr:PDZ domain-containing protein [Actinomycetota bacterium]
MDTTDGMLTGDEGSPSRAPDRRRPWWMVVLAALGLLLPAAGITGQFVTLPYDSIGPGSARDVSGLVSVKGHASYPPAGRIMYTTVSVRERVNAFEALAGWLDPATDVVPEEKVRGDIPADEYRRLNIEAMADSKTTAQLVALRHLGFTDLGAGAEILSVQDGLPASSLLKPRDVIVAVDGTPVSVAADAVATIRARKPGDTVQLRIVRGDTPPVDVAAPLAAGEGGRPLLGVRMGDKVKLPFEITIESGRVIGPSAGLAYALEILEVLTPGELTGGVSVAATGELRSDGVIGPIGGVAQKAVTVERAGARVFLVPKENLAEAKGSAGDGLQVHGVGSFAEALTVLGSLEGSNALALGAPRPGA